MTVTILGRRWQLRFVPFLGDKLGDCDVPTQAKKEIRIWQGTKGMERLDTIIHEVAHAALPDHDEAFIEQFGTDLARILWRLGYRQGEAE